LGFDEAKSDDYPSINGFTLFPHSKGYNNHHLCFNVLIIQIIWPVAFQCFDFGGI